MRALLAALLSVLTVIGCEGPRPSDGHAQVVGLARLNFYDTSRSNWAGTGVRPVVTYVWYPAAMEAKMTMIGIPPDNPIFVGGKASRDASFRENPDPHPLVVMSHGTGGAGMQMMWLGRELAAQGFFAAAVDHHGNTAAESSYDPRGFRLSWERARDLSVAIDLLLGDPKFGPQIDSARIGVVGYSLGGYTAVALAGGITDLAKFSEFCGGPERDATCDPQPEYPEADEDFRRLAGEDAAASESLARESDSYRDERISSFVVLAPALIQAFSPETLKEIDAPFLVISGTSDQVAPAATNADQLLNLIPGAHYMEIDGAGHYVFLNECSLKGRMFVLACKDSAGTSRARIHADVSEAVAAYLSSTLDDE